MDARSACFSVFLQRSHCSGAGASASSPRRANCSGRCHFPHEPHHFPDQAAFLLKDTRALFVPDRGDTLGDHYMDPKGSALAAGREGAPGGVAAGPTPGGAS